MDYIKEFREKEKNIMINENLIYEEIVEIKYCHEFDKYYESTPVLYMDFLLKGLENHNSKVLKVKFFNICDFSLKKCSTIKLDGGGLIMKDINKENGWSVENRYHIHDDSGYGENDGYQFIEFYCEYFEILS